MNNTDFHINTSPNIHEQEILNLRLRNAILNDNDSEIEKLFSQGAYFDVTNDYGLKLLIHLIKSEQTELVKKLLKSGTNLKNANEGRLMAALIGKSGKEHLKLIKILLDTGFNVNAQDNNGMTALMFASHTGNDKLIKVFLDASADVNRKSDSGKTALMFAVTNEHGLNSKAILQTLLNAGADVNSRDDDGKTALIHAIESGSEYWRNGKNMIAETIKILLESNADLTIKDKDGKTALIYAIERNCSEVKKILERVEKI